MRRLGFFVVSLLIVSTFFSSPSPLLAQSADTANKTNQAGTYDDYQGKINEYFTETGTAFDSILARTPSASADYKNQQDLHTRAKQYLASVSKAYTDAFNAEKAKGTPAVDAQIIAIRAYTQATSQAENLVLMNNFNASSPYRSGLFQLGKKISDASFTAEQIKRGVIQAGGAEDQVQTGGSGTISNAVKGNTNTTSETSAQADPKGCSLVSGNLLDCVDQLFAWFLRVTVLQIANVLFLLAAQILNISIVQGIYNFATWATDNLYTAWLFIRQVISLLLVFGTLALGFLYMVGREAPFTKAFAWMIIFALFVNFSYPITKSLIQVSNVISLNLYAATVGVDALKGNTSMAAGTLIQNKLGLIEQVKKVNDSSFSTQKDFNSLGSTPNVVLIIILVLYAAYVLFMVSGILIARTVLLILLIPASPLLLVDSVIPRLGEAAMKMRKLFFEQLVVAPAFMLMLALTLKFMDVFKPTTATDTPTIFFNLIISILLIHLLYKVVKEIAGKAGQFATDIMGKVGGFGLGLAAGGTGLLARGTIGAAAARVRGSAWLDEMQGSRTGRFMKRFTNSLAQSSFDTRNIGLVSQGMAKAGMGMGKGSSMTYDKSFAARQARIAEEYKDIKNDKARQGFYDQVRNGPLSLLAGKMGIETGGVKIARQLDLDEIKLKKQDEAQIAAFAKADDTKRKEMILKAEQANNQPLVDKLTAAQNYFDIKALKPQDLKDRQTEAAIMKNDLDEDEKFYRARATKYAEKVGAHGREGEEIDKMERELQTMDQSTKAYADKKKSFDVRKQNHEAAKVELDHENAENTVLLQNLQNQRVQYQSKQKEADTEREKYVQEVAQSKAKVLAKTDSKTAMDLIEKDSYAELTKDSDREIQALEKELQTVSATSSRGAYLANQIQSKKIEKQKVVDDLRSAVRRAYHEETSTRPANQQASQAGTQNQSQNQSGAQPNGANQNTAANAAQPATASGNSLDFEVPAYQAPRTGAANTYAVSNQLQQLPDGSFLHQGNIYATAIEAARAMRSATQSAGPAPAPRPNAPPPAPRPGASSAQATPSPAPTPQSVSNMGASDSVKMPGWPGTLSRAARAYSGPLPENEGREYLDPRTTASTRQQTPPTPSSPTSAPKPVTA